jgi:hypothetical protein
VADYIFNIAKGRFNELISRLKAGTDANARLYLIPMTTDAAQATAIDVDDFAALITAGAVERTTGGWNRKTIAAADISAMAPDDTNDRFNTDMIDQTWTAVAAANNVVSLILCYASVLTPTNAQMTPLAHYDFAITTDGTDVVAVMNAAGVLQAA